MICCKVFEKNLWTGNVIIFTIYENDYAWISANLQPMGEVRKLTHTQHMYGGMTGLTLKITIQNNDKREFQGK